MVKIYVIIGSTRQERFGERAAKWVFSQLKKRKEVDSELIDLRDWPLPFFDEPQSPMSSGGKYVLPLALKWANKIDKADGFVIITPEYNHGYPAVLKNALDYVYRQWFKKPVAFFSYGASAGGARAVEQLKQVVLELQMIPVPTSVNITYFWNYLDSSGNLKTDKFLKNTNEMLDELIEWAKNLKSKRK